MNLLKIGSLNIPKNRWLDALAVFDILYVVTFDKERLENERIKYIFINNRKLYNRIIIRLINLFKSYRFVLLFVLIFYYLNKSVLDEIKKIKFDYVYSSYNDFDDSSLITIALKKVIGSVSLTRAYKESRPEKNYLERVCFELADRIVLNDEENLKFFMKKHPLVKWSSKNIILDMDEDVRYSVVVNSIEHSNKLSSLDDKVHLVILSGVLNSDNRDKRSGQRSYYIPILEELIKLDYVIHLYYKKINNDIYGNNKYLEMQKQFPENIYLEGTLNFDSDYKEAYRILSRYDYGILHNISSKNKFVSVFDRINIPHRFYEYLNAGVIPIIFEGTSIVVEKIIKENGFGLIINSYKDIAIDHKENQKREFVKYCFVDYISSLYAKDSK